MADNRLIVITGVSRGLGRAMVEGFIGAGHTVAGCARSSDAIAALEQQFGAPHRFDVVDVSDHDRAAFTVDEALSLARRAGLHGAVVRPHWPQRYLLSWERAR